MENLICLHQSRGQNKARSIGFTLVELLVVMSIVALLVSIAAPRYFNHVERAKENSLRQSLATMRDAIDKFQADRNQLPDSLDDLVAQHYLRSIPKDPYTDSAQSWAAMPSPEDGTGVYDVHSGAEGNTQDGTPLNEL
ncbi:type II secretion system protein [Uliginosibacterium gangwonense]|uniref:type II secretion system protein n=1 Tax=Uliginosibacterium gangwonense TaxID=392736 RepID=UPI001FDF0A08|nr:prepilin-type N-terminal cleavage/methylation domain-containing protein [Uliginosibacterium gangwonense]